MHDPVNFRLQVLIASLNEAVLVEDERRLISLTNRAFCQMFGIPAPPEALIGMDCSRAAEESKGHFLDPEAFVVRVQAILAAREVVIGDRLEMVDGRVLERDYVPVFQDGGYLGHLWKYRDITAQVRNEEKLREAMHVAEHSARAKERFLANMSHEIRTPLNAVIGTAHLLASTPLDGLQQRYVDAIRYSADTLLSLINDILDLTKIGTGNLVFESIPFRLRELVTSAAEGLRTTASAKGLSLQLELDAALPAVVQGDPTRLTQVLLNLLSNAVKFTERGSVTLAARVAAADGERRVLEFRVRDTGIGIAPHNRESIFDRFTQERGDTTRRYGGTGLGLAIVRELVTRQGGDVRVESEVGAGSTFIVTLPVQLAEMPPLSASSAGVGEVVDLSGVRVFLVEDNALNQFVATQLLSRAGATIDVADNGLHAIERLRTDRAFDVILMDIQMPEMDGFEATRRIRRDLGIAGCDLPILALTASALVEQRAKAVEVGMDDFVMKPFDPDDLKRRIASAVWRARKARELAQGDGSPAHGAGGAEHDAPPTDESTAIDFSVLEAQTLGQPEFTVEMIDVFLENMPPQWAAVRAAAAVMDRPALHAAAHKLKSASAVVGAQSLRDTLETLEELAPSASEPQVAVLVHEALVQGDAVRRSLLHARARYAGQCGDDGAGTT